MAATVRKKREASFGRLLNRVTVTRKQEKANETSDI